VAVVQALERIQPGFLRRPQGPQGRGALVLATASAGLAGLGVFIASTRPDGIQRLMSSHTTAWLSSPLADYRLHMLASPFLAKSLAGLIGLLIVYLLCLGVSRALEREGA
jgi:hypothetical protein